MKKDGEVCVRQFRSVTMRRLTQALLVALFLSSLASAQNFRFSISGYDTKGFRDTLDFGVHPQATVCQDTLLGEKNNAGPPPFPFMFTWTNPRSPDFCDIDGCFDCGRVRKLGARPLDLRRYQSPTQIDTYKISLYSYGGGFPFSLAWMGVSVDYCDSIKLGYTGSLAGTVVVNMLQASSCTITDASVNKLYIVKWGARNPHVVAVAKGWNIVSVPEEGTRRGKTTVFPTASSYAYTYVADSGYQRTDSVLHGEGYWMKFPEAQTIIFGGPERHADTLRVEPGWNLIGSIGTQIPSTTIASDPPGLVTSEFFGYQRVYFASTTIGPGNAYWVKVRERGKLILGPTNALTKTGRIRIMPGDEVPPPPPSQEPTSGVNEAPEEFALSQNYPNPFNPSTVIRYRLPVQSKVTLTIYNLVGQEVADLVDEIQEAGFKQVEWDASGVPSGVYFYRLQAGIFVKTRELLLVK